MKVREAKGAKGVKGRRWEEKRGGRVWMCGELEKGRMKDEG